MDSLVDRILDRYSQLKMYKLPWLAMYEVINEFVMLRIQSFYWTGQQKFNVSQFVPERVFDSTAPAANFKMAASLIGSLYPNADRTFVCKPSHAIPPDLAKSDAVKKWFEQVTKTLRRYMSLPEAKFMEALEPYMHDQGAFGTSGIAMFDHYDVDPTCPFMFLPISVRNAFVAEDAYNKIDSVYMIQWLTVRQIVQKYGINTVSATMRDLFVSGKFDEKFEVLHAIEPRTDGINGSGNRSYPVASVHIEMTNRHILANTGFTEMPVFMVRFWKVEGEAYGRCPAMTMLPDILEVNAKREAEIIATEKLLDPPLLVDPERLVNNGVVDTSAGALNAKKNSGRAGEDRDKPIEELITVGELVSTIKRISELQFTIKDGFYNDDLRNLTNAQDQRMTAYEADIQNDKSNSGLVTVYNRQINELFTPLLSRGFNILLLHGLLGVPEGSIQFQQILRATGKPPEMVIPKEIVQLMAQGQDIYYLEYISPAGRALRSEELKGIQQTVAAVMGMMEGGVSTVADVVDWDEVVYHIQNLTGAPSEILKSAEAIADLRKQKSDAQGQQMGMEAQSLGAHTAKAAAQAAKAATEAGIYPMAVLGGGASQAA